MLHPRVCACLFKSGSFYHRMQVPGEMFKLAMAAKRRGMGVVGSTQNILDFIAAKLSTALRQPYPDKCAHPGALLPQAGC